MSKETPSREQLPTLLVGRGEQPAVGKPVQKPRDVDEQEIVVAKAGNDDPTVSEETEVSLAVAIEGVSAPPPALAEAEPAAAQPRPAPQTAPQARPPTDTVPLALQHGPRELRHMRHLGLIKSGQEYPAPSDLLGRPAEPSDKGPAEVAAPEEASAPTIPEALVAAEGAAGSGESGDRPDRRERKRRSRGKALKKKAKAEVQSFLAQHGFKSLKGQRRRLFRTSYPLHVAVRERDVVIVRQLLVARANPSKADSAGRTPLDLAEEKNYKGSHSDVIALLTQPRSTIAAAYADAVAATGAAHNAA